MNLKYILKVFVSPFFQNKARSFIRDSNIDFFSSLIKEGKFIDSLSDIKNIKVRTVKLKDSISGMIELLQYYSHPGWKGENVINKITKIGCSHFAITVEDLDTVYKELVDMGLKFNSIPEVSPDGNAKVCFCRDFDGTLIELVEELN